MTTTPTPPPASRTRPAVPLRALLILPAGAALLLGLNAALQLLGTWAPVTSSRLADQHGYLMTLGFVGTLIALERAVALGRLWGYAAPVLLSVGSIGAITPLPTAAGAWLMVVGASVLAAIYRPLWLRNRDEAVLVQALGAVCAVIAAALRAGGVPVSVLIAWLAGFVILTIAGERLELARFAMGPRANVLLSSFALAYCCAALVALLWPGVGYPLLGVVVVALTAWLAANDVANKMIRTTGHTRFMAACMLAGYGWLLVAGMVWIGGPAFMGGPYDAVIHAVFIGFTISMIMAHSSVILPAVIRRPLPYRPVMWVAALVVHGGLVARIWLGDLLGIPLAHTVGGVANVVGVAGFFVIALGSALVATRSQGVSS